MEKKDQTQSCSEVRGLFFALLDGELDSASAARIRAHIMACPDCRREFLAARVAREHGPGNAPVPGGDWLGKLETRMTRAGSMEDVLKVMFIPWEKKIPLWTAAVVIIAVCLVILSQSGCCDRTCPQEETAVTISPSPPPVPQKTPPLPRLRVARSGGVLIMEEPEGLPPRKHQPALDFFDHFVTIKVDKLGPGLDRVGDLVSQMGGQVIGHPVKGFDNMGSNEKLVLFEGRAYVMFLDKLKEVGEIEYPPLKDAEFVTARLTLVSTEP